MNFGGMYKLSDAKYWLNCSGWSKLVGKRRGQFEPPAGGTVHPRRAMGLALHDLVSGHLSRRQFSVDPNLVGTIWQGKDRGAKVSHILTPSNLAQVQALLRHVEERLESLTGAHLFLELKTDNTAALPVRADDWHSYLDIAIVHELQIELIELKFGSTAVPLEHPETARFPVDEQTFLELAVLVESDLLLRLLGIDKSKVLRYRLTVYQPNAMEVPDFQHLLLSPERYELLLKTARARFRASTEKPTAVKAGSWCGYCPAQAHCRAFDALAMSTYGAEGNSPESLQAALTREPDLMSHEEVLARMRFAPLIKAQATQIEKYGLAQAQAGVRFEGYRLVRANSPSRYSNDDPVHEWIGRTGLPLDHAAPRKLLSPKQLKALGKLHKVPEHLLHQLDPLVVRPPGRVELKPESSPASPVEAAPDWMFDNLNAARK